METAVQQWFYAGVMMTLSVISLLMIIPFRERIFAFFTLLTIIFTIYFLTIHGIFIPLWNIELPEYRIQVWAVNGIMLAIAFFISDFLDLNKRMPLFNRVYLVFPFLVIVIMNLEFFFPELISTELTLIQNVIFLLYLIFTLIPVGILVFTNDKQAKILLISILIAFLGTVTFQLDRMGIIAGGTWALNGIQIGTILFSSILFYGLFEKITAIKNERIRIKAERDKSDELILNILPAEIADELKEKGQADARHFEQVSILFTDFKDFTHTAENLSARDLVEEISFCFKTFDHICDKYGVEKIKTIGDAYMAAGGLAGSGKNNVINTVLAALEMAALITKRKSERNSKDQWAFQMRTGIHTGPVIAGIVGVKKFQYDLWGDTVNTASRMESAGEVGKVNISHDTYELIKDDPQFRFESRGKIQVKGKGEVDMYFVVLKNQSASPWPISKNPDL